jgi:hypothetical protein
VDGVEEGPWGTVGQVIIGINSGSFGTAGAADVKACVGSARLSQTELPLATFQNHWNAGIKIMVDFAGPFNSGGVQAMNAQSYATNALNWYKANTDKNASPWVEILNEPAIPGSGWGSSAFSQANATAYRNLVTVFCNTWKNDLGSQCPIIVASYDGGRSSDPTGWGRMWWNSTVAALVDGITMHSYASDNALSTSQSRLTAGHNDTGKLVYVTELGWTTSGTLRANISEADQASHIFSMAQWMSGTGWVAHWDYFNYTDFSGGNTWGVRRADGSHKPSYAALHNAFTTFDTGVTAPPPPQGELVVQQNPSNPAQFQITAAPTGTLMIHLAEAQDTQGTNIQFRGQGVDPGSAGSGFTAPFSFPINFTPQADHPAVQALAYDSAAYSGGSPSGNQLGTWTDWVLTSPAPASPVPDAVTDAPVVAGSQVTYNGHADAHGASGATFHFDRAPVVAGVVDEAQITKVPLADLLVGDVASTLAYPSVVQNGTANNALTATVQSTNANGFTNGRFMLAVVEAKGVSQTQTTITPPTTNGTWIAPTGNDQQFANVNNGAHRVSIYYRFAGASEVAESWTFSQQGSGVVHTVRVLAFDGVNTSTPLGTQNAGTGAKVAWLTNPASATSSPIPTGVCLSGQLQVFGGTYCNDTTTAAFPSQTPSITHPADVTVGSSGAGCSTFVGIQAITADGSTQSKTATLTDGSGAAADTSATFTITLVPASGGGSTNKAIQTVENNVPVGLWATRANVTTPGSPALHNVGGWLTFAVAGTGGTPQVSGFAVSQIDDTSAVLSFHLEPVGAATTWRVQYSTDGQSYTDANTDQSIGTTPADVTYTLEPPLVERTEYFVRLVVTNAAAPSGLPTAPQSFTTTGPAPITSDAASLLDLRNELKARGFHFLPDARCDLFINDGYQELVEFAPWPFLRMQVTDNAPMSIPDLRQVLYVADVTGGEERTLRWIDVRDVEDLDPAQAATGTPCRYWLDNLTLNVWPQNASSTIKVRYLRVVDSLVDDIDQVIVPPRYNSLIVGLAQVRALAFDRDGSDQARTLRTELDRELAQMEFNLMYRTYDAPAQMLVHHALDE